MRSRIPILLLFLFAVSALSNDLDRQFNQKYAGPHVNRIAFPLGGIGAGMVCIEGNGCISNLSIRHQPEVYNEPFVFGAIAVKGSQARVLEGPVQRFPFATVPLEDSSMPLKTSVPAWSPFVPTDPDNSSLPVCALEYTFTNPTRQPREALFSYNAGNFMRAAGFKIPSTFCPKKGLHLTG